MTNEELLDAAKHVFENKKLDNSYVLFENDYVYRAAILELVTKGLLIQKNKTVFLITSELENFITANDGTLESDQVEREKEILKVAKEANTISKSANSKAILAIFIGFVSIVISIIAISKN